MNNFNIHIANAPKLHSSSNGQVERFHSTLTEIARCIQTDKQIDYKVELIVVATIKYNRTIYSVTNKKPIEVIHSAVANVERDISERIQKAQEKTLEQAKRNREYKTYKVNEEVWVNRTNGWIIN